MTAVAFVPFIPRFEGFITVVIVIHEVVKDRSKIARPQ
jgi:hypothetical protein